MALIMVKDYSQAMFVDFLNFSDRFTSTKIPDREIVKISRKRNALKMLVIVTFWSCLYEVRHLT